jgi:phage tail-like protein
MPIGEDALAGYSYAIEIDGQVIAQFSEVSGIKAEVQAIEYRYNKPGGLPVLKWLPGAQKFGDIQLKRGTTQSTDMWKWFQQVQKGDIDTARKHGSIVLYDYKRGEIARFNFQNGWPSAIEVSNLKAGGNDINMESVTIKHEGIGPA